MYEQYVRKMSIQIWAILFVYNRTEKYKDCFNLNVVMSVAELETIELWEISLLLWPHSPLMVSCSLLTSDFDDYCSSCWVLTM